MTRRGFSLLEVMAAMVVMLIGSLSALQGIMSADQSLREGQLRLHKQVLIDATLSRSRLYSKDLLYNTGITIASAATMPDQQPLATGNWTMDPTPLVANDPSTGSLYFVTPDGTMTPCTATTTPACIGIVNCASAAIPELVFCREVVTTKTAAGYAPGLIVASGTFVTTRWVRVIQKKKLVADTLDSAVLGREVYAQ